MGTLGGQSLSFFQVIWFNKPHIGNLFLAIKLHYAWPNSSPHLRLLLKVKLREPFMFKESECQCRDVSLNLLCEHGGATEPL